MSASITRQITSAAITRQSRLTERAPFAFPGAAPVTQQPAPVAEKRVVLVACGKGPLNKVRKYAPWSGLPITRTWGDMKVWLLAFLDIQTVARLSCLDRTQGKRWHDLAEMQTRHTLFSFAPQLKVERTWKQALYRQLQSMSQEKDTIMHGDIVHYDYHEIGEGHAGVVGYQGSSETLCFTTLSETTYIDTFARIRGQFKVGSATLLGGAAAKKMHVFAYNGLVNNSALTHLCFAHENTILAVHGTSLSTKGKISLCIIPHFNYLACEDSERMVMYSYDNSKPTLTEIYQFKFHSNSPPCFGFAHNGGDILTRVNEVGYSWTVNLKTMQPLGTGKHIGKGNLIGMCVDHTKMATISETSAVIWDLDTVKPRNTFKVAYKGAAIFSMIKGDYLIISTAKDLMIWDIQTGGVLTYLNDLSHSPYPVIPTGFNNLILEYYDAHNGCIIRTQFKPKAKISRAAPSPMTAAAAGSAAARGLVPPPRPLTANAATGNPAAGLVPPPLSPHHQLTANAGAAPAAGAGSAPAASAATLAPVKTVKKPSSPYNNRQTRDDLYITVKK